MAKISGLPLAGPLTGSDKVPIVQDGLSRSAPVGQLLQAALVGSNYYPTLAEGLAATSAGDLFSYPDGDGNIVAAERTALGHTVVSQIGSALAIEAAEEAIAEAQAARTASEAARDAAFVNANVYADVAAGLAATAVGQQFQVVSGDEVIRYRVDAGPVATMVARWSKPNITRARLEAVLAEIEENRGGLDVVNRLYQVAPGNTGQPNIDYRGVGTVSLDDGDYLVITIPANDYISINISSMPEAVTLPLQTITAMVIEAARNPLGTIALQFRYATSSISGGGSYSTTYSPVQQNPTAGVYTRGFQNTGNGTTIANVGPRLFIQNTGAQPVKIFMPIIVVGDFAGKVPPARFYQRRFPAAAYNRDYPVRSFDFWKHWGQDAPERQVSDRHTTKAASSSGSNANSGTRHAPLQTLAALHPVAADAQLGLARKSEWTMETLPVANGIAGISVRDLSAPGEPLPIISLFQPVATGDWTASGDGTYNYAPAAPVYGAHEDSSALDDDGYDFLTTVAVNLAQEAAGLRWTARQALKRVTSQATCAATPGSYYAQNLGGNVWRRYVHLPDSSAPGTTYRVEVVNKWQAVSWYNQDGRVLSGIHAIGSCSGYGLTPMGDNSLLDRFIHMHGTAHTAVIKSGLVQRGFVYSPGPQGNHDGPMITFYRPDGGSKRGIARQLIFQGNISCIYAHISSGSDYASMEFEDIFASLGRNSAGALYGVAIATNNVQQTRIRRVYVEGYATPIGVSGNKFNSVRDSAFFNVSMIQMPSIFENNVVRFENWSDATNVNNRGTGFRHENGKATLCQNNLLHHKITDRGVLNDNSPGIIGSIPASAAAPAIFRRNLIVIEPAATNPADVVYVQLPSPGDGVVYLESDYNVIVNFSPSNRFMVAYGKGTKTTAVGSAFGFRDDRHKFWNNASTNNRSDLIVERMPAGSEAHSYYFDLSEDPRGISAVFVDAANGDYRWADTDIARQIAAACRECGAGPDWRLAGKPKIPTAEEAVALIQNA